MSTKAIPDAVEKVARAICRADGHDPDADWSEPRETKPYPAWKTYEDNARAAIAAMGGAEPVAWERRQRMSEQDEWNPWRSITKSLFDAYGPKELDGERHVQVRALYASPSQGGTRAEVVEECARVAEAYAAKMENAAVSLEGTYSGAKVAKDAVAGHSIAAAIRKLAHDT